MKRLNLTTITAALFTFVLGTLLLQSVVRPPGTGLAEKHDAVVQECRGEAIEVDYPFEGGFLEPWACQVQCDDQRLRYVLYANGKATQCQPLPGCNDWGEDNGITCQPPGQMSTEE